MANGVGTAMTKTSAGATSVAAESSPRWTTPLDQSVEIDFLDVDRAAVDRVDHLLRHVDAADLHPRTRDDRRGGEPDVAEPDDADRGKCLAAQVKCLS